MMTADEAVAGKVDGCGAVGGEQAPDGFHFLKSDAGEAVAPKPRMDDAALEGDGLSGDGAGVEFVAGSMRGGELIKE